MTKQDILKDYGDFVDTLLCEIVAANTGKTFGFQIFQREEGERKWTAVRYPTLPNAGGRIGKLIVVNADTAKVMIKELAKSYPIYEFKYEPIK